ncbi:MAG: SMC-Scp complex subunit ScpB [Candidatus Lokiarchaeota archaeon]|nr:SMC-Scp complex subunit ScpB [Candidatus Lokiarchaeota archaeon]
MTEFDEELREEEDNKKDKEGSFEEEHLEGELSEEDNIEEEKDEELGDLESNFEEDGNEENEETQDDFIEDELVLEESGTTEDSNLEGESIPVVQKVPDRELTKEELEQEIRKFSKNSIEAALYAAGKPLDVEILSTKLEIPKKEVSELIIELALEYLERDSALIINQIGESFQMAIKSEYVEKVSKFAQGGAIAERYLRTLTIIALKQPILKSTVIKLRGSGAYEHIKFLLDNDFIEASKKGRSHELMTTDKYAEMFGLPKDKNEMKKVMIEQLGMGNIAKEGGD